MTNAPSHIYHCIVPSLSDCHVTTNVILTLPYFSLLSYYHAIT